MDYAILGAGLDMAAKMSVLPSQEKEICSPVIANISREMLSVV
jgi:hypothetical protein